MGGGEVHVCNGGSEQQNVSLTALIMRDTSVSVDIGCFLSLEKIVATSSSTAGIEGGGGDEGSHGDNRRRLEEVQSFTFPRRGCYLQPGAPWPALGRNCHHTHSSPFRLSNNGTPSEQWSAFVQQLRIKITLRCLLKDSLFLPYPYTGDFIPMITIIIGARMFTLILV